MIQRLLRLSIFITLLLQAAPVEKQVQHLEDDPLFHAKREVGFSLHDAINRVIDISPKIKAAREVVIQNKVSKDEAFAGHLPVVNFSGDGGYELRDVKADANKNDAPITSHQNYKKVDLYLTITENLWTGGSIQNSVDEKSASLRGALFDYQDKIEKLVVETMTAYFDVVYAEIALKIANKNMKSYEKILKIVDIKEKNGAATKGDVNFIKANVDNARTALVQKEKILSDALAKYSYLLQTEDKRELPFEISSPLFFADLNTSLEKADKLNAQLQRQKSYIKASQYAFLATQASFHPKVDFAINGESRNEYDIGLGKREKLSAILMFNYNLYSGGKDEANAIKVLSKMKEQKYLYQDLRRKLIFDIKVLNQSVSMLSQSLKFTEQEVLSARKVVNSYWVAFQHGTQDLQALQLAQRNLNSAEQNYAQYKKDLLMSNYEFMQKTGVLLQFLEVEFKKSADDFDEDYSLMKNYYEL